MRKLQINWYVVVAILAGLIIVGHMNSKLIKESKKTDLEKTIESIEDEPIIKLNPDSPEGTIITYDPEATKEPVESTHHK